MQNIELKVKVDSLNAVREKLAASGATKEGVLHQVDTYFNTEKGRLKLREIDKTENQLIYYERPNEAGSKLSTYELISFDVAGARKIKQVLEASHGVRVVVEKDRELWIYKHTRVHLDDVRGLCDYAELETVVQDIAMSEAEAEHRQVIELLGLDNYEKCDVSYSDLLLSDDAK